MLRLPLTWLEVCWTTERLSRAGNPVYSGFSGGLFGVFEFLILKICYWGKPNYISVRFLENQFITLNIDLFGQFVKKQIYVTDFPDFFGFFGLFWFIKFVQFIWLIYFKLISFLVPEPNRTIKRLKNFLLDDRFLDSTGC